MKQQKDYTVGRKGIKWERAPQLLTGLARAFLDRNDSGRAAPLGLPVLRSEATLTRVRATVASADGSSCDAYARARARALLHRRAIATEAITATRAAPLTARVTLAQGAHRAAAACVPHHTEVAGVRCGRTAGQITSTRAFQLRSARHEPRVN